jgi:hypothetical protein
MQQGIDDLSVSGSAPPTFESIFLMFISAPPERTKPHGWAASRIGE